MSNEAVGLIKNMLVRDPADRISAYEALNNGWINNGSMQALSSITLENLRNFHVNME